MWRILCRIGLGKQHINLPERREGAEHAEELKNPLRVPPRLYALAVKQIWQNILIFENTLTITNCPSDVFVQVRRNIKEI